MQKTLKLTTVVMGATAAELTLETPAAPPNSWQQEAEGSEMETSEEKPVTPPKQTARTSSKAVPAPTSESKTPKRRERPPKD
jgi:hypothetical protein